MRRSCARYANGIGATPSRKAPRHARASPLLQGQHEAAGDDDGHADGRPPIGKLAEDEVAEQRRPDHLQVSERREQRCRGDQEGGDDEPVRDSREQPQQQQEPAFAPRQRCAVEPPRQREREADRADQRAVEERRVRAVAGQLARQQLIERVEYGGSEQQQRRPGAARTIRAAAARGCRRSPRAKRSSARASAARPAPAARTRR